MKFVSKSTNLYIVLTPGLSAQPLTGFPAKPTVAVRFKDGLAIVPDGKLVEMMLAHPGFGGDFIAVEEGVQDPYLSNRQGVEPAHILTEIKYGSPTARKVAEGTANTGLSPEIMKLISDQATKIAMEIAPKMASEMAKKMFDESLQPLVEDRTEQEVAEAAKSDDGRIEPKKPIKKTSK